jgi:hypothetical protein
MRIDHEPEIVEADGAIIYKGEVYIKSALLEESLISFLGSATKKFMLGVGEAIRKEIEENA